MRAGALDRRVTLQRASLSKDDFNNDVEAWVDIATVWASYEPVRDGEKFRAGETAAGLSARFVIRYSSMVKDVDPRFRLILDGKPYAIIGVKETGGRGVGLEITCAGRADDGT